MGYYSIPIGKRIEKFVNFRNAKKKPPVGGFLFIYTATNLFRWKK